MPSPGGPIWFALGLVALGLIGCGPSAEQRAAAVREGRNPRGTSKHAQADRVPTLEDKDHRPIGPREGYLADAFVYASARAATLERGWDLPGVPLERWVRPSEFGVQPSAWVSASLRRFGSAGTQLRVHIPVADRAAFEARLAAALGSFEPAPICAQLGSSVACVRDPAALLLVRAVPEGYVADRFSTGSNSLDDPPDEPADEPADDSALVARIQLALALVGGHSRPEVEALVGDAVALIDGPRWIEALDANDLNTLHEVPRLFDGVTLELEVGPDRLLARGRWLENPAAAKLQDVFALDPVDADVPSVAALCEGSLVCGRSRGVPRSERFAGLATGPYRDLDELVPRLTRDEAMLLVALETWPNVLAAIARWPADVADPSAVMVMRNAADIGARVLGFGFSRREAGWLGYARTSATDLDAVRGFLQLAGSSFAIAEIPKVDARVTATPPGTSLPRRTYTVVDADRSWGWLVAADGDAQVEWLIGLDHDHDDGAVPIAYLEIPDLGRWIDADPDLRRRYGAWAKTSSPRGLRAELILAADATPELHVALGGFD